MDTQTVIAALDATEIDETYVLAFVTMLTEAYDGLEDKDNFDTFRERLNEQIDFPDERERFLLYAEDADRMDLVKELAELGPDQVKAEWDQAKAEAAVQVGQAQERGEPPDPEHFTADLRTYRGYWDGTEEGWPAFLDAFQAYAEGAHGQVAVDFFARAAAGEDKTALFAEYGVADRAVAPQTEDASWQAVVEQFGSSSASWDGSDLGWAEFRDRLYNATNSHDPTLYALVYEQLQPLNDLPPSERVAQLRELGFDMSGAAAQEAPTDLSVSEQDVHSLSAERLESFEAVADDPAVEGVNREVLDELLKDPEFDQRIAEAVALVDADLANAMAEAESN